MSFVVVDDHLLGDLLADMAPAALATVLRHNRIATTNLYYYRLCRAVLAGHGGTLTGSWAVERRQQAARELSGLSPDVEVLPLRLLAFRMAELARSHRLSALGAEAVAAAERLGGSVCVWEGDDGPGIRSCCAAIGVDYRPISRD